jgi:putative transposase
MPAKHLQRIVAKGTYSHVYNKAIEGKNMFNDELDYQVFLAYLKGYLSAPIDPNSVKQTFTVKGRTFKGTPHQPKNYFGKIELTAYSLIPDHFHLVLHQLDEGSIESFIRSLCTRYSMYFNKKYKRSGALFSGPYKSIHVENTDKLKLLTQYLHHNALYSSYLEYTGSRDSAWVRPLQLSVENYNPANKSLISDLAFDDHDVMQPQLERRNLESKPLSVVHPEVLTSKKSYRIPEVVLASIIFLIFFATSISNINANKIVKTKIVSQPIVLGTSTAILSTPLPTITPAISPLPIPTSTPTPDMELVINITDGSPIINIRKSASAYSEKVGEAKNNETYPYISAGQGWYQIKLQDGTGYVSANYVKVVERNN